MLVRKTFEEEKEVTTRIVKEITANIIAYFEQNEEEYNTAIEGSDSYNGYLDDERYYSMDNFNELHKSLQPDELLRRAFYGYDEETYSTDKRGNRTYGEFNPNREYFRYNTYGNLLSISKRVMKRSRVKYTFRSY